MKILIVGTGGREHALLWKLRQDAPEAEFFITRGNGGTAGIASPLPFSANEINPLAGWAEHHAVDLTVVGPEGPLDAGIVDHFQARGLAVFGPSRAAAQIESSKAFAKGIMARHRIPTADYRTFHTLAEAEGYIREQDRPLVVKASGLAGGKGAIVCDSPEEAVAAARRMMSEGAFGEAGRDVVVEERMEGEELSVFALTDGTTLLPLLPSQDHKRIGEGDTGPNTGGMGAYAPVSLATGELLGELRERILEPILAALRADRRTFRGLLYAGVMLTDQGPRVVEFNCRFGDPETQAVLPLLDGPLLDPLLAIARGDSLAGATLAWRDAAAVTTVLAAPGYPGSYPRGIPIRISPDLAGDPAVTVFHAGTTHTERGLVTDGGRVLAVTGVGREVAEAAGRSRAAAERIEFEGKQFRRDIGWREIQRMQDPAR